MTDKTEHDFGPVIYSYTREQAIADGVLCDVTEQAKETGFKYSVVITESIFCDLEPNEYAQNNGQSFTGRLHDLLFMCALACRAAKSDGDILFFEVILRDGEGPSSKWINKYKAHCGPGDNAEPVVTIMQPHED